MEQNYLLRGKTTFSSSLKDIFYEFTFYPYKMFIKKTLLFLSKNSFMKRISMDFVSKKFDTDSF